jgi:ABC-type iron transport system FetAB permease component
MVSRNTLLTTLTTSLVTIPVHGAMTMMSPMMLASPNISYLGYTAFALNISALPLTVVSILTTLATDDPRYLGVQVIPLGGMLILMGATGELDGLISQIRNSIQSIQTTVPSTGL